LDTRLENQYPSTSITESKIIGLWKFNNEHLIFKPNGKGEVKLNNSVNDFNYIIKNDSSIIILQEQKERIFYLRKNNSTMFELFTDNTEKIYRVFDYFKQENYSK
jgi:hypothetical protein